AIPFRNHLRYGMAFSSVSGLSTGLSLFSVRGREIGVLQEKNYYYSALFQTEQMFHVSKIWEQCGLVVSQVALVAISSVGIFFSAFVAHGHYDWIASRLYLPTELPVFIIHASHLLSEHAGDLVQIAALVGSI